MAETDSVFIDQSMRNASPSNVRVYISISIDDKAKNS